ncbi:hypothetical protein [Roseomonas chloroacetimidivorans]|uniref:hypothetical protein n=1 Tax=Roseomonas chloroacetimidivorans TaxID=1766656 RepID=UPI003C74D11D
MSDTFTTGQDVSIDIYDPVDGSIERIDGLTGFEATARTTDLESHPLNGDDLFDVRYQGFNLTMEYDRQNGKIDRYFANREARQRSGLPVPLITITETIREQDGSVTTFRYRKVVLKQDSSGNKQRDQKVTGRITGMGTRELVS